MGEKIPTTNAEMPHDEENSSGWEGLSPENNGLGEFDEASARQAVEKARMPAEEGQATEEASMSDEEITRERRDVSKPAIIDRAVFERFDRAGLIEPGLPEGLQDVMAEDWEPTIENLWGPDLSLQSKLNFWQKRMKFFNEFLGDWADDEELQAKMQESERRQNAQEIADIIDSYRLLEARKRLSHIEEPLVEERQLRLNLEDRREKAILMSDPWRYYQEAQAELAQAQAAIEQEHQYNLWVQEIASGEGAAEELARKEAQEMLAKIPAESKALLRDLERQGDLEAYRETMFDMLRDVMGINDQKIEIRDVQEPDEICSGRCHRNSDGSFDIIFNTVKPRAADPFENVSAILSHELYHCFQRTVGESDDYPMRDVYIWNRKHRIKPEADLMAYRLQYREQTAYDFDDGFTAWLHSEDESKDEPEVSPEDGLEDKPKDRPKPFARLRDFLRNRKEQRGKSKH